ncbi:NUDIX hydrolase domain-like protein [Schizophyllum commune]
MSSLPPTLETILPSDTSLKTWVEHAVGGTQHPWMDSRPFKGYTNAFIVRDGKILLGMKKRGFGIGKINGFGGKVEPDESSRDAAIREMEEESGIRAPLEWAGTLLFFLEGVEKVFHCDVYRAESFEGEVVETDEMRPAWYSVDDIPYAQMWEDDPYWLPLLVAGTPFIGRADFDAKPGKEGEFVMRRWWVGKRA